MRPSPSALWHAARSLPWHTFVLRYIAERTASARDRARHSEGWAVREGPPGLWTWGAYYGRAYRPSFTPADPATAYGWLVRSRQFRDLLEAAETARYDALQSPEPRARGPSREEMVARYGEDPRDNPRPAAWSKLRGSTPYPCKARAVGKQVRRQGREYTVESCATPARTKPAVGQFWLTRPGVPGHAVPRPAVSRALRRGARPPAAELFARWGRKRALPGSPGIYTPERFGAGLPEPDRRQTPPLVGASPLGAREVVAPELVDEWTEQVTRPASWWRVELWEVKGSGRWNDDRLRARVYEWDGGRWVLHRTLDADLETVTHRTQRWPAEVHDALDDLLRSMGNDWPIRRALTGAFRGEGFSRYDRPGLLSPPGAETFQGPAKLAYVATRAAWCADNEDRAGEGWQEQRKRRDRWKEIAGDALLEACGGTGEPPRGESCARLYQTLSSPWQGAGCQRPEVAEIEQRCPRRLGDQELDAWAKGEAPLPELGPYDVPTEHQTGGAGDCCYYAPPMIRRRQLHREVLSGLPSGADPTEALRAAEEKQADRWSRHKGDVPTWRRCDERVRREVEKRRAALTTGAEGSGGETGLELLLGWWRAAKRGDTERAFLLGSRAISEGEVKYDPDPGWEQDPGDATMFDALLEALASSPSSSQRKRAILAELDRGSPGRITPALRERVLGATVRREAASRAQRAHAGKWKRGGRR